MAAQSANGGKVTAPRTQSGAQPTSTFVIRKAQYGDLSSGPALDVTDKVRSAVKNNALSLIAVDRNFGDPYNGTMKLTIIRAELKSPGLQASDFTGAVKQLQDGNCLSARMTEGKSKVTIYYKYGEGAVLVKEQADDGSLDIIPPTKLRVDYTLNGVNMSKAVDSCHTLNIFEYRQHWQISVVLA